MKSPYVRASYAMLLAVIFVVPAMAAEEIAPRVIWRSHKDKANASTVDKVKVKVGQFVEIDWHFPVVADQVPNKNDAKSSDPCVSVLGIASILPVPIKVGEGTVSAAFRAEKEGTAMINFTISDKTATVTLKCEVEVIK